MPRKNTRCNGENGRKLHTGINRTVSKSRYKSVFGRCWKYKFEKYVNAVKKELYIYKNSFAEKVSISIVRLSDKKWISTTKQELEDSHADFSGWGVFRKANETAGAAVYSIARDSLLSEKNSILYSYSS